MHFLRRFVDPIHHIEVADRKLVTTQRGKRGITRKGVTGRHFRKRFRRIEDTLCKT